MRLLSLVFFFFIAASFFVVTNLVAQEVSLPPAPKTVARDRYLTIQEPIRSLPAPKTATASKQTISKQILPQTHSPTAWTFDQVISAMLTSDPKLRIGKEDIRQARAEHLTSSLLPNPDLTVEGGAFPFSRNRLTEETPGGPPELNVQVEFPIDWFLFAKRKAAMNSARLEVRQAQAEYANLIRERITETATLFYDLLEAKALLDVTRQDRDLLMQLEKAAKDGVAAGGMPAVEWKRISLDLLQCRQELLEAEKTLDILKAQLRAQFGRADYDPDFDIAGDLDVPAVINPMPMEAAFAMAQQNRPDIRALRTQVAKSKADVHAENRNAYPEVTSFAGFGREYQKSIGDDDYKNWGIGVTVTVPLFDRNQGNRAKARSALAQSNHQYRAGIVDLRAEIVEADRNLRTAHQQANTFAAEEVNLSKEVRDIMIEGFKAGGRPLIDVLDAERSYRETMRLFITCRANYWRAFYVYNSVVGVDSVNNVLATAR